MSRLALSRKVQWSAGGDTICVHSRVQNHLNLSSLSSGIFDGRTKKKIEEKFWKNEKNVILAETRRRHSS